MKFFVLGAISAVAAASLFLWSRSESVITPMIVPISPPVTVVSTHTPKPTFLPAVTPTPSLSVTHDVPFTVQAPTANWDDALYQNACEESSILMAARWLTQETITPQYALTEIREIADRADTLLGTHVDESARDTATLAQEYLPHASVVLIEHATIQDITDALGSGKVVLVPLNGKLLQNPHYKPPGPLRHMLVVKGYDAETKEFITNDPGTRFGEGYRYPQALLFDAMHDWDTGDHTPIHPDRKVVIVVGR